MPGTANPTIPGNQPSLKPDQIEAIEKGVDELSSNMAIQAKTRGDAKPVSKELLRSQFSELAFQGLSTF